jgi:hypothetical protein
MAKQEHVFVGAFSNKALKQLKKTFEVSAEVLSRIFQNKMEYTYNIYQRK